MHRILQILAWWEMNTSWAHWGEAVMGLSSSGGSRRTPPLHFHQTPILLYIHKRILWIPQSFVFTGASIRLIGTLKSPPPPTKNPESRRRWKAKRERTRWRSATNCDVRRRTGLTQLAPSQVSDLVRYLIKCFPCIRHGSRLVRGYRDRRSLEVFKRSGFRKEKFFK